MRQINPNGFQPLMLLYIWYLSCCNKYLWLDLTWGPRKCAGWPLHNLDPKSRLWRWSRKIACLPDKVRTTNLIAIQLGSYIPIVMLITWLDFGEIILETFFGYRFFPKISDVFFQGQTLSCPYLRNGPLARYAKLRMRMRRECRERFPRHRR